MKKILIYLLSITFVSLSSLVYNVNAGPSDKCVSPEMYNPEDEQCYCPDGSIDLYRAGCFTEAFGGSEEIDTGGIINSAQLIFIFLSIIVVIYGGISYMTSLGDEYKTNTAKKIIYSGIGGLIIVVLAKPIASFIMNFF